MMSFEIIVNMVPQADESMGITIFCLTYLLLVFNNVSLNILGCLGLIINFSPSLLSAAGTDQMEVQRDFELKDGDGGTATVAMKGGQLVDLFSSVHEHSKNASSFLFFFFCIAHLTERRHLRKVTSNKNSTKRRTKDSGEYQQWLK